MKKTIPSPIPHTAVHATSPSGRKLARALTDMAFRIERWPEPLAKAALESGMVQKIDDLLLLTESVREGRVTLDLRELGRMVSHYLTRSK